MKKYFELYIDHEFINTSIDTDKLYREIDETIHSNPTKAWSFEIKEVNKMIKDFVRLNGETNYYGIIKVDKYGVTFLSDEDGLTEHYSWENITKIEKQLKNLTIMEMAELKIVFISSNPDSETSYNGYALKLNDNRYLKINFDTYINITNIIKDKVSE